MLFLKCKSHTCCQSRSHSAFLLVFLILIFLLVRLLCSSRFCSPPFVVNSAHASLQHFNLCCCSPSLKAELLNASPPWLCSVDSATPPWLPGTMALHKGPRSLLHHHKIPPAQRDSRSKSHSPPKHTHIHWCFSGLSCHPHTVLLRGRRSYALTRDIQKEVLKFHEQKLDFFFSCLMWGCYIDRKRQ